MTDIQVKKLNTISLRMGQLNIFLLTSNVDGLIPRADEVYGIRFKLMFK